MLRATIWFFVLALVAITLSFTKIGGTSMNVGVVLFVVFLVLGVISYFGGMGTGRGPKQLP